VALYPSPLPYYTSPSPRLPISHLRTYLYLLLASHGARSYRRATRRETGRNYRLRGRRHRHARRTSTPFPCAASSCPARFAGNFCSAAALLAWRTALLHMPPACRCSHCWRAGGMPRNGAALCALPYTSGKRPLPGDVGVAGVAPAGGLRSPAGGRRSATAVGILLYMPAHHAASYWHKTVAYMCAHRYAAPHISATTSGTTVYSPSMHELTALQNVAYPSLRWHLIRIRGSR